MLKKGKVILTLVYQTEKVSVLDIRLNNPPKHRFVIGLGIMTVVGVSHKHQLSPRLISQNPKTNPNSRRPQLFPIVTPKP